MNHTDTPNNIGPGYYQLYGSFNKLKVDKSTHATKGHR